VQTKRDAESIGDEVGSIFGDIAPFLLDFKKRQDVGTDILQGLEGFGSGFLGDFGINIKRDAESIGDEVGSIFGDIAPFLLDFKRKRDAESIGDEVGSIFGDIAPFLLDFKKRQDVGTDILQGLEGFGSGFLGDFGIHIKRDAESIGDEVGSIFGDIAPFLLDFKKRQDVGTDILQGLEGFGSGFLGDFGIHIKKDAESIGDEVGSIFGDIAPFLLDFKKRQNAGDDILQGLEGFGTGFLGDFGIHLKRAIDELD
jgi:hypothetical protein